MVLGLLSRAHPFAPTDRREDDGYLVPFPCWPFERMFSIRRKCHGKRMTPVSAVHVQGNNTLFCCPFIICRWWPCCWGWLAANDYDDGCDDQCMWAEGHELFTRPVCTAMDCTLWRWYINFNLMVICIIWLPGEYIKEENKQNTVCLVVALHIGRMTGICLHCMSPDTWHNHWE